MFNVKLSTGGGENAKVKIEATLKISKTQLPFVINKAHEAFRRIEVIDQDTGELAYSSYLSSDLYMPMSTEGEVLDEIYQIIEDME